MMGYMRLVTANENTFPRNGKRFPIIYYQTIGFNLPFVFMSNHIGFCTFLYCKEEATAQRMGIPLWIQDRKSVV